LFASASAQYLNFHKEKAESPITGHRLSRILRVCGDSPRLAYFVHQSAGQNNESPTVGHISDGFEQPRRWPRTARGFPIIEASADLKAQINKVVLEAMHRPRWAAKPR
jgi:hypothetical protein